ncbi:MAG: hypothetical protein AAB410_03040 [Patescibacteria group bacterium]
MALPIQLKFFKKIELYQEYKSEEYKAATTDKKVWITEKEILRWTTDNHHHLGSEITKDHVRRVIFHEGTERFTESKYKFDIRLNKPFENLVQRGYATKNNEDALIITREGLLMGEVINDVEKNLFSKYIKYNSLYWLVWITAIAGALTIVINFIKAVSDLI